MKRIEKENVLESPRFSNLLVLLKAYPGGMELKEFLVAIKDEKSINPHYLSAETIRQIQEILPDRMTREYRLQVDKKGRPVVPINEERLCKDLSKLIQFDLVWKDEKTNRYHLKELYAEAYRSFDALIHIAESCRDRFTSDDTAAYLIDNIHIFNMDPQLNRIIQSDERYRRRMRRIAVKLQDALEDLERLRSNILRDSDYLEGYGFSPDTKFSSSNQLKSSFTVVMHTYQNMTNEYYDL